jgi:hypothetical protein
MLRLEPPQDFDLLLTSDGKYTLRSNGVTCRFSQPASTRGIAKLYTLSSGAALLYVGIAEQPMSSRLSYGFRANGRGGYYGYKWKTLRHSLRLSVWTAVSLEFRDTLRELETVEAEVAFLCRQLSGQWPQFQNEIHFYASNEGHREAAQVIYAHATAPSA